METKQLKRCFDEVDQDEDGAGETEEWSQQWQPCNNSLPMTPSAKMSVKSSSNQSTSSAFGGHERTIIHIDMDCFYAQVEMIRDPTLREKPLGIQQKNIVVTCNYVAREKGVGKLSYVKDAVKICPELVLVSGEDLTKYREMSYKVTDYLLQFSPLVERLGFDENFIDVTNLVKDRQSSDKTFDVNGHTYYGESKEVVPSLGCSCGCHQRLAIGSQIASEMRSGLKQSLGLTSCAGIAHNKLLSKLVAGTHKPNQQTVLFPHQADTLLLSMKSVRQIPGIGSSISKRLSAMGIVSIQQLKDTKLNCLQQEFGYHVASTILSLSHGCDTSPVVKTGPPQSLSDEDSFKMCNSVEDARKRTRDLIRSLLQRLKEDGRVAHTIRLAVRKRSIPKQWTRESRQCPLPDSILQDYDLDTDTVVEKILDVAMNLFMKLVDTSQPFHLTLISVCFTKLEDRSKKPSITSYFKKTLDNSANLYANIASKSDRPKKQSIDTYFKETTKEKCHKEHVSSELKVSPSSFVHSSEGSDNILEKAKDQPKKQSIVTYFKETTKEHCHKEQVFSELKKSPSSFSHYDETSENILQNAENLKKRQRIDSWMDNNQNKPKISDNRKLISELFLEQKTLDHDNKVKSGTSLQEKLQKTVTDGNKNMQRTTFQFFQSKSFSSEPMSTLKNQRPLLSPKTKNQLDNPHSTPLSNLVDEDLPPNVDPSVFLELPSSVQKELIDNWKRETVQKSKIKPKPKELKKSIKDFFATK